MRSMALYSNDNGEPRACMIEHDYDFDITAVDLKPHLPEFNVGGPLFLWHGFFHDYAEGNPNITDGYGQEVVEYCLDIRGATITQDSNIAKASS